MIFSLFLSINTYAQHCTSNGSTSYSTGTTYVGFGSITNTTGKPSAYTDYNALSTTVSQGGTETLTIRANTDGNYTVHTFVWIDWNQNNDFNDVGESFDLGDVRNVSDGATSNSPFMVSVPIGATIGTTRMRVSTRYNTNPGSCDTGFDGEVEDYRVNVVAGTPTCTTTINSFPYDESFESGLGGWTQDTSDDRDWTRQSGGTPSNDTGPNAANNGSFYLFTEGSNPNFNSEFNLISPCIDLTAETAAQFSFYYHMYGTNMGDLNVDVSTDNGVTFGAPVWTQSGEDQTAHTDPWVLVDIDLAAYIGQIIKIRFNGITGSDFTSDISIDSVSMVTTFTPGPNINVYDSVSNNINDGSTNSPSLVNSTDFGNLLISTPTTITYTIQNTGTTDLIISSITSSNSDFVVSGPVSTTITSGSTTTFDVTATTTSASVTSGTITINSNSPSPEDAYTFDVQATGITASCSSSTITLPYIESFETGTNGWNSGGSDASRVNNAATSYDNSYSFMIRSNSGTGSAVCSPNVDLTSYDKVDFKFFFYAEGFELNETFTFEYSDDDGANWQVVRTFTAGNTSPSEKSGDFEMGSTSTNYYVRNIGLLATNYTFSSNSRFRFQSSASDTTDNIYIDNISITGITYSTPTLGPGGITADLSLWLQADKLNGTTVGTDGTPVSQWTDTGIGNDAAVVETGNEPTYRNSTARNINFNPVIDFTNDNNTAGGDMTYLDGREVLESSAGFNSNDIFMVVMPDTPVNTSTIPLDTFTSFDVTANNTYVEDVTGFGFGNYSARLTGEVFAYAVGSTNTAPPYVGFGRGVTDTSINMNQISIINTRHNTSDTGIEIYQNANQIGDTTNDAPDFSIVTEQRFWLGRSQYWQGSFDGRIAEVITYTGRKNDTDATQERNRIQSYLAIKYGITLEPTITAGVIEEGNLDYVDSDGSVIWDESANNGYNYDIAGIGRDDASGLDQRQSSSINSIVETFTITPDLPASPYNVNVDTRGIVTMGLSTIETTNSENRTVNPTGFATDKNFIVWGDNNADLDATPSTIAVDMSANISGLTTNVEFFGMQRVWKVVETGNVARVKVSIPEDAILNIDPPGNYLMFISDTGVFTPTAQYRVMSSDGSGNLLADYDFPPNSERFITFGYAPEEIVERSINFVSGASNYIDVEDNLDLDNDDDADPTNTATSPFTLSTWIKREAGSTNTSIVSKRDILFTEGYDLKINLLNRVEMSWINGIPRTIQSSVAIPENEWHHIAITHDGTTARLYIDGVLETTTALPLPLDTTNSFLIGAAGRDGSTTAHFDGNIDEVRVWNAALTPNQLRFLMNQELEDNAGTIGKYFDNNSILPTKNDASGLDFSNLRAYFPMSRYTYTNTNDDSGNDLVGYLRQLRTVDFQTAPLPYISTQNGNWTDDTTWTNGAMQTIPGARSLADSNISVDWNIVETSHDVTIDNTTLFDDDVPNVNDVDGNDNEGNRTVLAHILTSGTITIDGDNTLETGFGYTVTHYLEMNGKLDLEGESQLIQTTDSDLILGPSGELERDQQGTSNKYRYNYWGSPVGATSIAPASLNPNRYSYSVTDIFRDGASAVNFTSTGYDGDDTTPVTVADYWIWKFANNTDGDYSEWEHMRRTGTMEPGEGFTMKGTDTVGSEQNYTFLGKPNNADINLTISQYNDYLVGNPYASAIDARQFIIDNGPTLYYEDDVTPEADATTSGTLYFWEHWGGNDHILANYQAGYGTYNLSGSLAAPFSLVGTNDPDVGSGGTPTKIPGRYIPVGQGFFVVASNGGTINFNNGQRVFKKETISNGIFFRNNTEAVNSNDITDNADPRQKIKLGFDSVGNHHRQLLLTIDENTTPGVDWGYDGITYEYLDDDMFWGINNGFYVIQASDNMNDDTSYPLIIYTSEDGNNTIKIDELVNIDSEQEIYLHDIELDFYHNLKEDGDYEIFLNAGYYDGRFEIVFSNENASLGIDDDTLNEEKIDVRYANANDKVILINPHGLEVKDIQIYNILGQHVVSIEDIKTGNFTEYNVGNLSSGPYIIKLNTVSGSVSKKVLVD
ncbi:hypothetical protein BTO05_00435 [Winogradskyella sp. PC-19]|nr:hypothetical protein BTO05_00435 [Winogradskyella sp. PC-19]